jgi:hypothetical protein
MRAPLGKPLADVFGVGQHMTTAFSHIACSSAACGSAAAGTVVTARSLERLSRPDRLSRGALVAA